MQTTGSVDTRLVPINFVIFLWVKMSTVGYSGVLSLHEQPDTGENETSVFTTVPFTAPDPIFDLTAQYLVDKFPKKVNLGQGTYRDGQGQPWVLPAVKAAKRQLENSNHEYLPILGLQEFRENVPGLILGESSKALAESRVNNSSQGPWSMPVVLTLRPPRSPFVKRYLGQELCICSDISSSPMSLLKPSSTSRSRRGRRIVRYSSTWAYKSDHLTTSIGTRRSST
jgi:hypothetical protein